MRKGCCRMAAAFSLRKEYQMTGKNERKLKKWTALFLAAAMSLTACGSTASTGSSTSSASGTSAVSESSTSTASADHAVDFQPLCFRKIGLLVCGTVNQHRNGQGCQTLCGVGQTLIFLFQKFFRSLVFVCFLIRCLIVFIVLLIRRYQI